MTHAPGPGTERSGALRVLAVLPARIGSTRLPRKMLLAESGLPLFVHAVLNARQCPALTRIVVACDDDEIERAGRAHGIEMVRTHSGHASGTDRVREGAEALGELFDVVINVQPDEPELDPRDLTLLIESFVDPALKMATLAAPITDPTELDTPGAVKVVVDRDGYALYFSRSHIPSASHSREGAQAGMQLARRHIGVYAFRPEALQRFCDLPVGALEMAENLEQLRWLENGGRILVRPARRAAPGIDTRADYDSYLERLRAARGDKQSLVNQ